MHPLHQSLLQSRRNFLATSASEFGQELIDHDENHQPALRRRRGRRQKERGNHLRMTGPGLIDCRRACIVRACSRLGC